MSDQVVKKWLQYPTGKIDKGSWCDECARFNTRNVTCSLAILCQGKILLIERQKDPSAGYWALPGGYLGWDETVEECAKREIEEEIGLKVTSVKLNGVFSNPARDADGRQNVECSFWTEITEDQKSQIQQNTEEAGEVQWFDLNDLPNQIAFDHRQEIEALKKSL